MAMNDTAAPELLVRVTERLREQIAWASSSLEVETDGVLPSLRPLHDLQAWFDVLFADAAIDGSLTLVFLLDHLLEEAFENLAGDFRYDPEADSIRRGFFHRLGQSLGDLAQSDLSDPRTWAGIVDAVLSDYTDVLAKLNQHQLAQLGLSGEES
jgi:hypothetical protein